MIASTGETHLDAEGVTLGLIGVLEVLWQGFAFQNEAEIDRAAARRASMAYLRSVFPRQFGNAGAGPVAIGTQQVSFARAAGALADTCALEWTDPGHDGGAARTILIGKADNEVLTIVYEWRDERARIVSARKATDYEAQLYSAANA